MASILLSYVETYRHTTKAGESPILFSSKIVSTKYLVLGFEFCFSKEVEVESETYLQCVEVSLQLGFLVCFGGFGGSAILTELLQFLLSSLKVLLRRAIVEPGHGPLDPLQELSGEGGGGGGGGGDMK